MKIKLKSNGQIINPPLRVAERYIRLGRAIAYVEPAFVFDKQEEEPEVEEVLVKKQKKKKTKKVNDSSYTE